MPDFDPATSEKVIGETLRARKVMIDGDFYVNDDDMLLAAAFGIAGLDFDSETERYQAMSKVATQATKLVLDRENWFSESKGDVVDDK